MPSELAAQTADLIEPLRRYWGYDAFRPLQERIVRSLIEGRDIAVVMPTGGGKSLCYQLPAVILGGTAIVISPLISLMQDQAAQLAQMGIPAAVLNSSLGSAEQSAIMRNAIAGAYRLLYLSPERLARPDTVQWLRRAPLSFFAIDEAHCISEWGHEFRPDYRQLSRLREQFPQQPIAAFTASATQRVRHDIIAQLSLRSPDKYIVSFHRPNLRYLVHQSDSKSQPGLLLKALRACQGSNVIVYAPTVARVEETVDFLAEHRVRAVPYHGQMETGARQRNQERWMSDEVPILVGTLAFGLGINKPSVRAVIHLALPKSVEQYYQEAGRAGRDGIAADCLLLWQPKDAALLAYFINQLKDPAERERSWQRYHSIRRFAENGQCRHRQICLYFGETPRWQTCGMCDVCAGDPEWMFARREKRRTEAPRPSEAPRPAAPEPSPRDPALLEMLREWRRKLAQARGVPAFMILTDSSLLDLCAKQPATREELINVSGVGERKAEQYGDEILAALASFQAGQRATPANDLRPSPAQETIELLREGCSFNEIAARRGRQLGTVIGMVADLVERGEIPFDPKWIASGALPQIEAAVKRIGPQWLKPLREALPAAIPSEEIRLVVAKARRENAPG